MTTTDNEEIKAPQFTLNEDGTVTVILSAATAKMLDEMYEYAKRSNPLVNELMNIAEELAKDKPEHAEKFAELKEHAFGKVNYAKMVASTTKAMHSTIALEGGLVDGMPEELRHLMGKVGIVGGRSGGIAGIAQAMESIARAQMKMTKMGDLKS